VHQGKNSPWQAETLPGAVSFMPEFRRLKTGTTAADLQV
jgi:hypothetical protein